MLVLACKVHHLGHLGFGDFERVNPAYAYALLMHMQHDAGRFIPPLIEKPLQDVDDELHRRVIVVEQQNFIKRWLFGFWGRASDDARLPVGLVSILVGHFRLSPRHFPSDALVGPALAYRAEII